MSDYKKTKQNKKKQQINKTTTTNKTMINFAKRVLKLSKPYQSNYPTGKGLTHLSLASHERDTDKQCRPRSDAVECGV